MPAHFFVDRVNGDSHIITGEDASHIIKSLRMKCGEQIILCDDNRVFHTCEITGIMQNSVAVNIISSCECDTEPLVEVTLFQALTKGDKIELIIQKAIELGVTKIVPVITERCISRPDKKSFDKKLERWQKIAKGAAMQSCRGIIPEIKPLTDLNGVIEQSKSLDKTVVFYEKYGDSINTLANNSIKKIGIITGCEGGFEESEIKRLNDAGIPCATLGKRILRAETAPLTALSIIMYITENRE